MPLHAPLLKYFREVAASGSVRLAARRLHVSSSAVNRQILKIENELGTPLFARSASGMQLTAAGRVLLAHIERTLLDAERSLAEIRTLIASGTAPITLAGQESVISEFLPPVLVELHAGFPNVASSFKAAGGDQLLRLLGDGLADVAIVFDAQTEPGIAVHAVRELPVAAIVSPAHPLAKRRAVSIADCIPYPLILPDESWPLRRLLDAQLADVADELTIAITSNSVEFLRSMINQQAGVGFQTVVGIERRLAAGELVLIPLENPDPVRQRLCICVADRAERTPALEQLLILLRERLNFYSAEWS